MADKLNFEALQNYYMIALATAKPHLSNIDIKALAANATSMATEYARNHPYSTAWSAVNIGLLQILGPSWMVGPLLRLIGFTPLGPAAGESRNV